MRLPALAIAASYASGIALGLWLALSQNARGRPVLLFLSITAAVLILAGFLLAWRDRAAPALCAGLGSWVALGAIGGVVAPASQPANHVTVLAAEGVLDLHAPLRWRAWLRDEPASLPWGVGYELELEAVGYGGKSVPLHGGMRLSYSPQKGDPALPELHAGDEITAVAEARLPQVFKDEGALDRRAYLAQQGIDLTATLRAPELIERTGISKRNFASRLARLRHNAREKLDGLFANRPEIAATLRAMLLGDRNFVERSEAEAFQKTGVFHVLVVAGLHVGAFAAVLFWAGRRLRVNVLWTSLATMALLLAYVGVVEQRPPVLRAALMAGFVVTARILYRRLELLNTVGLAALLLLVAKPAALLDSSFQLTFAAVGCVAGLALPWLEQTVQPYARALRGWRDVTRDATHEPRAAQFRIDLRMAAGWATRGIPMRVREFGQDGLIGAVRGAIWTWELFALTLALQIGMLPWMASDFHRVTLAGPLANLAAVPLTGVIVPLGFVTLVAAWTFPPIAKALALALGFLTSLLLHAVGWFATIPRGTYRIPGPPAWLFVTFCAFAMLLAVCLRIHRQARSVARPWVFRGLSCGLLACAVAIAVHPFARQWAAGKLELTVLDVGQGDSLLLVSPKGRTFLIDGGGAFTGFAGQSAQSVIDPGEEAVSPYLWSRGFRRIDVVALTHAHQDHLGGLKAVLENFAVGELWLGTEIQSRPMQELERLARERGVKVRHTFRGARFDWDGASGEFLWPEATQSGKHDAANNDSLVLRLRFGKRELLLPGDAERQAESEILQENGSTLRADVLKVGHHGSRNATLPNWLTAVQPQVAIISVGENNPYGHPNAELVERLQAAGARILRTDRDGAVHVVTDGENLEVRCFVACPEDRAEASVRQTQTPDSTQNRQQE